MTIYFIEVPHQGRPKAWLATDRDDAINRIAATAERSDATIYATYSLTDVEDIFGETPDHIAISIAREHGEVVHGYDPSDAEGVFSAPDIAPSEWDCYLNWNFHDLSYGFVFESPEEAKEWIEDGFYGHQGAVARDVLTRIIDA